MSDVEKLAGESVNDGAPVSQQDIAVGAGSISVVRVPADSPQGTAMPRHLSAIGDKLVSMMLSIVCAKQLPDTWATMQVVVLVLAYLGYYFLFESLFCTTPGKFTNGLVVRDFDGGRCSLKQTTVRTLMRLIEVNPVLLGALPAAASILWSKNKQRLGDKWAGTVVVFR